MDITGRIISVLAPQGGVSQRTGQQWASQNFVLQTDERFPQKLLFKVFGVDRLKQWNIQMGEVLTVQFSVDAHESNGRWFGENTAYNIIRGQVQQYQQQPAQGYAPQQQFQQPMQQMPPQQQYQQAAPAPFPAQQAAPAPQAAPAAQPQGQQLPFPPAQ